MAAFVSFDLVAVCITCVLIVIITGKSDSLRDFAKVLKAHRRRPPRTPWRASPVKLSRYPLDVKKKPDPARVTRAQDEVNDRKAGLHIAKWTLHFTKISALIGALALVVASVGIYLTVHYANQSDTKADPGTLVVIKPDIGVGGEPILATPLVSSATTPVDYLRGGTQLRIDCVKEVDNKYGLAHISGSYEQNDWIDATSLVMPNGDSVIPTLTKLGACKG